MAAAKSAYLAAESLKLATGQTNALGTARTPYLALLSDLTAAGEPGTEVTGAGYARLDTSGLWTAPTNPSGNQQQVNNNADVQFAEITPVISVKAVALFDAVTGGNLMYSKPLGVTINYAGGSQPRFATGDLALNED